MRLPRSAGDSSARSGYWIRIRATRPSGDTRSLVPSTCGSAARAAWTRSRSARGPVASTKVSAGSRGVRTTSAPRPMSADPARVRQLGGGGGSRARAPRTGRRAARPKAAADVTTTTAQTAAHVAITTQGRRAACRPSRSSARDTVVPPRCVAAGVRARRPGPSTVVGAGVSGTSASRPGCGRAFGRGRTSLSAGPGAGRAFPRLGRGEINPLRSVLDEPRAPSPPARVWRDWALVGAVVVGAVLEVALREDLRLPWLCLLVTAGTGADAVVAAYAARSRRWRWPSACPPPWTSA